MPAASVAVIARDVDVSPSSIYHWLRKLCSKLSQPTGFAAVAVHAYPPEIDHDASDMPGHRAPRCNHPCGWRPVCELADCGVARAQSMIPVPGGARGLDSHRQEPLKRQSETYTTEGMSISVSTLADYVGHGTVLLRRLVDVIEAHILAGERIHYDDTTVPARAAGKTITGRIWASVLDDRPFGGTDPPCLLLLHPRPHRSPSAVAAYPVFRHPAG